jgi:O-methyltransferase involved in polyketide biosynthesis
VRYRLERHRAGRAMDYRQADPGLIADELAAALKSPTDYLPVPTDGAAKAADLVLDLL